MRTYDLPFTLLTSARKRAWLQWFSVNLGEITAMRLVTNPGWQWSRSIKPIVQTESCQVHHIGYLVSGALRVKMDDGSEIEFGAGDAYNIPPGHDAWVVGDEPAVSVDFRGAETYAQPAK